MGQQRAPDGAESRQQVTAAYQSDSHARALDDIASVRDDELEHATPNSERFGLETMHDAAGNSDEDDDSDPHPNCHVGGTPRLGREQHERRMIAGKRARRRDGRDGDEGRPTRRERESPRLQPQPSGGRPSFPRDRRLATPVEREACRSHVHRSGRVSRVRDRDRAARTPGQSEVHRRDGECCRNSGRRHNHRPITVKVSVAV